MTQYKYAIIAESQECDPRNDIDAGTRTLHFGKDADPDYTVMTDDDIRKINHEVVRRVEAPRMMTKAELKRHVRENVLPLDEGQEAEA